MNAIIKIAESYLLTSKNKLEMVKKLNTEDEIILNNNFKILSFEESFKTGYKINTNYSIPIYGYGTSFISARHNYDFSDDYEYQEIPLCRLKAKDYVYLPYRKYSVSKSSNKFNISKYLYKGQYNYSIAKQDLIGKLNLPSWFLYNSLLTGVPEQEEYNLILQKYLKLNKYESVEHFKESIIKENSNKLSKSVPISKGLLDLVVLLLTNNIKFSSHLNLELNIDSSQYKDMTQNIILFLTQSKISFKLYNDIYKKDNTVIKVNSSFLYFMLSNHFNDYSILFLLTNSQRSYLFKRLFDKYLISFTFENELHALTLQEFLYSLGFLFNIQTLESFIENKKHLLFPLSADSYIKLDNGFLVQINSIESIKDTLIEINLQSLGI